MTTKKITDLQLISAVTDGLSVPSDDGIQTYRSTPLQMYNYLRTKFAPLVNELSNFNLSTSVGSSALTIAVKNYAGNTPTSDDPVRVSFRSATITSGAFVYRTLSSALSVVISSGSTLGQSSAQPSVIWVYLIDNAGSVELAVSHKKFSEDALVSTTAEGGAGGAISATVMYSTTARTSVACRLVGYILNTQTTAGTWASAGTQIQLAPFVQKKSSTIQSFTSGSGTYYKAAGATKIRVKMAGPGGGGGGASGSGGVGNGSNGSAATTFGTTLLSAGAGGGGKVFGSNTLGTGGTSSLGTGPAGIAQTGGVGGGSSTTGNFQGGVGGSNAFGGFGGGGGPGGTGATASANSGGGGGGAGGDGSTAPGGGGGAGGYVDAIITDPLSSYSYSVGTGGAAGSAGVAGGGAGASGVIIVEEFYD